MTYKRIVIKIGSNVLTLENGLEDIERFRHISSQIAFLKKQGVEIILVSSGAVAAGRSMVKLPENIHDTVSTRQLFAAIGQVKLINTYNELLEPHGLQCAQVLVTKEDFRDRLHYLNMRNCFATLLQNNILPVVNENDVISVTELMFTDNDELAGLIASMMDVDALIILTNVDGLFNGDPSDPKSMVIPVIDKTNLNFNIFVSGNKSQFGRGGMITKSKMAHKLAQTGVTVHIANGKRNNILLDLLDNKPMGTKFLPLEGASTLKRWIAYSEEYAKGTVFVNEGAKVALLREDKASSLLPVGITKTEGSFDKGDIIKVMDEEGHFIALGVSQFSSEKTKSILGKKNQKPLIHYDYLYINHEK
ncbi:MAG: glutamate 5-kinase [Bacteroidota bacterium]|nr:glutamate 5-kinase [Bacteroidota bacterium]MDP4274024.1 glutamate 5-kinase [Bacteroidota bacterium]